MAHYRSTLATTAVAVMGLVAAAHILHPGNFETQARAARPAVSSAQASSGAPAWADPPLRARAEPATAQEQEVAALPAPRAMIALNSDVAAEQPPRSTVVPRPERPRKVGASDRRKLAQRGARSRQAALASGTPAEQPAVATRPDTRETRANDRIDPIGDLIRGLGIGRDREG